MLQHSHRMEKEVRPSLRASLSLEGSPLGLGPCLPLKGLKLVDVWLEVANLLKPESTDLQSLIGYWHMHQHAIHALQQPPQVLMLRLMRFSQHTTHASIHKNSRPLTINPTVLLPVFHAQGITCDNVIYYTSALLLHCGATPHSGHTRLD